jgi:hypothetical protein
MMASLPIIIIFLLAQHTFNQRTNLSGMGGR